MFDLYTALKAWWLDAASGPQLLFYVRICSTSLWALAAGVALWDAAHDNRIERTWDEGTCKRFRVLGWLHAWSFLGCALYFATAAILEVDRTASPHRLLVGNVIFAFAAATALLDTVAWRTHYTIKRALTGKAVK